MIILDYSQISLSSIFTVLGLKNLSPEEQFRASMNGVIKTILDVNKKFKKKYGKIIIAQDNMIYWRKEVFPHYKCNRKKNREKSKIDWSLVFEISNRIREDLFDEFPYVMLNVTGAEADDVMAVIAKASNQDPRFMVMEGLFESKEPVLIVSSDGDMDQLLKYDNVDLYSLSKKKFNSLERSRGNIELELRTKIISGDSGDAIPNIRSADNFIVEGIRQPPATKGFVHDVLHNFSTQPEEIKKNYRRNEQLISFEYIPEKLSQDIIEAYLTAKPNGDKSTVYKYIIKNQLVNLMNELNNF